ncbi:MAG: hypothetical protein KGL95_06085, partial [Patescibacteria group bacterium]|nr:hypothetical protein [Patescibacteria group bacterium]
MQIIPLLLFLLLITSSISVAYADQAALDPVLNHDIKNNLDTNIYKNQQSNSREFSLDLTDDLNIHSNDQTPDQYKQVMPRVTTKISFSDKIDITTNSPDQQVIALVKQNSDMLTTMEKISNSDRIRFNGKSIVVGNIFSNDKLSDNISDLENTQNQLHTITNTKNDLTKIFGEISPTQIIDNSKQTIVISESL